MPAEKTDLSTPTPGRLWAEQLAAGMGLFVGLLIFMAVFHPALLSSGMKVLGPNYLGAYGWASAVGVILQLLVHEAGTLIVAWRMKVPLKFRFFPLGANAAAILMAQPRQVWRDAALGLAGPITGSLVSLVLAGIYLGTGNPFFLGMACVGYFYNLLTLIPILILEGGWIAPAIAPQAWLFGLIAAGLLLTQGFNLVLLGVFCFALPRFILLLRARLPRTDLACTTPQRLFVSLGYFIMVLGLAWLGSMAFEALTAAVPEAMGD